METFVDSLSHSTQCAIVHIKYMKVFLMDFVMRSTLASAAGTMCLILIIFLKSHPLGDFLGQSHTKNKCSVYTHGRLQ